MLIGELSRRCGCSRDTIRYYEKLGLLSVARPRGGPAYKNYTVAALARLQHIQRLKDTGFTLREIRALLVGDGVGPVCADLPSRLAAKMSTIDAQMAALATFKASLLAMQQACSGVDCVAVDGLPGCVPAGA